MNRRDSYQKERQIRGQPPCGASDLGRKSGRLRPVRQEDRHHRRLCGVAGSAWRMYLWLYPEGRKRDLPECVCCGRGRRRAEARRGHQRGQDRGRAADGQRHADGRPAGPDDRVYAGDHERRPQSGGSGGCSHELWPRRRTHQGAHHLSEGKEDPAGYLAGIRQESGYNVYPRSHRPDGPRLRVREDRPDRHRGRRREDRHRRDRLAGDPAGCRQAL